MITESVKLRNGREQQSAARDTVADSFRLLMEPGSTFEVRIPETRQATVSGYFDDPEKAATAIAAWNGKAPSIYVTLNPVRPELLARACNRLISYAKHTTSDTDVLRRRVLLIDADPLRPAGISSTDAEHEAALARSLEIEAWLRSLGVASIIRADSGNGGHTLPFIDLPNDAASTALVQRVLEAIAFHFSDDAVAVDLSVFNPARICKVYGTLACKGDATPERPHRQAKLLAIPETLTPTPQEILERIAALAPAAPRAHPRSTGATFDLDKWITTHQLDVRGPYPWNSGSKWIFPVCPWNPSHTNRAAYIVQFASGGIAAGCHHNGCMGKEWHDLRDTVEPGWRSHKHGDGKDTGAETGTGGERETFTLTDTGNAQRLVARHGENIRYCFTWKKWLVWDGKRWKLDTSGAIYQLAKETARAIALEEAKGVEDSKKFAALLSWSKQSLNAARLKAAVELAQSEPSIPVQPEDFDANQWLLNIENGTVDLKNGDLLPHRREDLITKLANVVYAAGAQCPTWNAFLTRIMNKDADLIEYLQRAAGYTLTGTTGEECLFFLHGHGRNGKTKLLEALGAILGDYGQPTEFSTFLHRDTDRVNNDIAALRGARFVIASEVNEGRRLNESLIKSMTGGDTITARFLFSEHFSFRPIFKLWLMANHKPVIRGTDHAIWERIKLIPFLVTIPEEERDKHLLEKFKAEASGILLWALEGAYRWQHEGLTMPEKVRVATAEYRRQMDVLGGFLEERCERGDDYQAATGALFTNYEEWFTASGEKKEDKLSKKAFGMRLEERGFVPRKNKFDVRCWFGLRLLNEQNSNEN